jgi:hypothetical protein
MMKRFVLTAVIGGAMFFSVESATAQVTSEDQEQMTTEQKMHQKEDWKQVEEQDLPGEVSQAIETDFMGATVSEAHVMEKDGEKKYKLVLFTEEGETKEMYADAQGNWIDKEDKKDKK